LDQIGGFRALACVQKKEKKHKTWPKHAETKALAPAKARAHRVDPDPRCSRFRRGGVLQCQQGMFGGTVGSL